MPKVVNKFKSGHPKGAVYVGRPTPFGNPYVIGKDGTRAEVIAKHREYVLANAQLTALIKKDLKGKDLVCFCKPAACHADTLLEIANE
jgi:hypothetical protein